MFDLYQKPAASRGVKASMWVYLCGTVLFAADLFRHSSGMHSVHGKAWFVVKCTGLGLQLCGLVSRGFVEQREKSKNRVLSPKSGQ